MNKSNLCCFVLLSVVCVSCIGQGADAEGEMPEVLRPDNLVAWCIVPFDAKQRGPEQRAAMLKELGIRRCAYDWRQEHVPTFEQEILAYQKHGIEFFAFWGEHDEAFRLFQQYDLHPQIWQTLSDPGPADQANEGSQEEREKEDEKVRRAAQQLVPLARRTEAMGCKLGLYNHGGWGGEPKNLAAVCQRLHELGHDHVGIVYNFHHGHDQIDQWPQAFALIKPYLLCLNLNGMNDDAQPKILGIGKGEHDLEMIRHVVESGYDGPIGILDHRNELDARVALQENLEGLERIRRQIARSDRPASDRAAPVGQHETPQDELQGAADRAEPTAASGAATGAAFSETVVSELVEEAAEFGDARRGAKLFADAKLACLSCHRIGRHGGTVGPELSKIGTQRTVREIVESVLWPERKIEPPYVVWQVLTTDGDIHTGYREVSEDGQLTLRSPTTDETVHLDAEEIEAEVPGTTVMPSELTAAMSRQQQADLICFLTELGHDESALSGDLDMLLAHAQMHGPATFPLDPAPVAPANWPHARHPVNRDRLYDFYTKQAEHFRKQNATPMLLGSFPGLDGGQLGHWGNQSEEDWVDGRWNDTKLGTLQAGVFRGDGVTVARGICLRLGDDGKVSACFNPDTLTYDAVWTDGFVGFSDVRHGFMHGLQMQGRMLPLPDQQAPDQPLVYHGFYRHGKRIVFSYRIGDVEYLDAPWVKAGQFSREVAPAHQHSLRHVLRGGAPRWPQVLETDIVPGDGAPFAVDTIELPVQNPWHALLFCGGHDFLPDGSALVCTMQGDVWRVTGLDAPPDQPAKAQWRRFASGLHHPLGLIVSDGEIFVQCRDQLVRLNDLNGDGEADFYECFSNAFETSAAGHDYVCGLQRDAAGHFYTASGNQGLLRISADGKQAEVLATGFRNPDGVSLLPDGTVTVPCSEGEWTPASMICAVPASGARDSEPIRKPNIRPRSGTNSSLSPRAAGERGRVRGFRERLSDQRPLHFGYRGPREGEPPALPLAYLPRGIDNSSGGQAVVDSERWQPLQGQLLHFSFGMGSWFLVLRDEVAGQPQGAVVPLAGDFRSGVHRARFRPQDGQLYVTGMAGWGSYTPDDGCFQRVRYTGDALQLPADFHLFENGIRVRFTEPIDPAIAENVQSHFAQCWNYRYSGAYGSPEYSTTHPGAEGHDPLEIRSAHVLSDGRSLFLEIPELQPVNQLHLRLHVNEPEAYPSCGPTGDGHDLFVTVHRLDGPFENFPGYRPRDKTIAAHPLLADLALDAQREPNPWQEPIEGARAIEIETGKNLTYATSELTVEAGEPVALTLSNPDVVPHNWVLVRPGALRRVGQQANALIADPKAFARQYIPESEDVLVYTDIVAPRQRQTISFLAPDEPGRYPFLCTFPGHWMVMNGTLHIQEKPSQASPAE